MANKKINQLDSRAGASLSDLSLVGDPINGVSYKLTLTQISTLMGVPGKFNQPTGTTSQYLRGDGSLATFPVVGNGTVTSVDMSVPTGLTISGNPITTSGTLAVGFASGYSIPTTASQATWNTAYNDSIVSAAVTGTTTKTLTLNQQDGGSVTASWSDLNTDAVTSVFGRTGAVVATGGDYTTTQVTEGTNLYYTDARARAAVSLTVSGSSGASTYNNSTGVFNIPTYTLSGLGGVPSTRSITINGTAFDLSADRTFNVGTVTSVAATAGTGITISGSPITTSGTLTITNSAPDQVVALTASTGISVSGTYPNFTITNTSPSSGGTVTSVGLSSATSGVTIGSTPITTSGTITLAIATATTSQNGLLSSTDWAIFNAKQNAITLTTTGTSGAATLVGATLNIPQYADQFVGTVTSVAALTLGTTGTDLSSTVANGTTTPVITLNVPTASATNRGALSSADWTTFNNKQSTITNPVTGTGTTNYLPKWTSGTAIGNSNLFNDANGNVGIGVVPSNAFVGSNTLEIGANGVVWSETASSSFNSLILGLNFYYNAGGTPVYKNSGVASSRYFQYQGSHQWYTAPSGTAGNAISFTQTMTLTANGRLLLGTTTEGSELLQVSGSVLATSFIKSGGTSSQYLMADGSVTTGGGLISTNRQTASYTLALTDADKLVEMNVATANNLTVPLNSSVAFAIGTKIDLSQYGAGQTTVVATSGVTVRSAGGALKLALQYSGASLVKIATNEWYLFGDITV